MKYVHWTPFVSTNRNYHIHGGTILNIYSWASSFGILLVKAEIVSWFPHRKCSEVQSFHMYGVIGSAVVVGVISVWLIKKIQNQNHLRRTIEFVKKDFNKGQIYGGLLFGLGWAVTGACPGPLFAQIGTGATVVASNLTERYCRYLGFMAGFIENCLIDTNR